MLYRRLPALAWAVVFVSPIPPEWDASLVEREKVIVERERRLGIGWNDEYKLGMMSWVS